MEIWEPIKDYEDYQVSDLGRVKITANNATRKERILKPLLHPKGYVRVALCKNNTRKFFTIHRLVALHFIENPDNKPEVNHKDGNKLNNVKPNLEWATHQENILHAKENRLSSCGQRNGRAKITQIQAEEIKLSSLSSDELSKIYGLHKSNINRIKRGEGWKTKEDNLNEN